MKYRRELTLNIKFQADRIFVRNDLFEQVIKSYEATNAEFLMFNKKLGICLYEENYYDEEIIQIQDDIEETDKESIEVIDKVSTKKSTKKLNKELNKESNKELNKESNKGSNKELAKMREVLNKYSDDLDKIDEMFKESNKESNKELNKESNKELIETISPKNDENTTNWHDKNKFNEILTILIIKIK